MSLPLPGAWIEIQGKSVDELKAKSLPLPGAWIEICLEVSYNKKVG